MNYYTCENKDCPQGARGEPSQFSGGMTAEQRNLLTGEPVDDMKEGTDYGDGICPTCGVKGKALKDYAPAGVAEGEEEE